MQVINAHKFTFGANMVQWMSSSSSRRGFSTWTIILWTDRGQRSMAKTLQIAQFI